ncbi:MAG: hypothetical protein KAU17_07125 [Spirochaetales bacterium]|jgi:hypothetical protein|nr:hypothetical protein [Spirochaetales bacterium]
MFDALTNYITFLEKNLETLSDPKRVTQITKLIEDMRKIQDRYQKAG